MTSREFETSGGPVQLRTLSPENVPALVDLWRSCAQGGWGPWAADQIRGQLLAFPEGQVGIQIGDAMVAACAAHIVHLGTDSHRSHTRAGITDDGYFQNHRRQGDTLYMSQVSVAPEWRRRGLATALVKAQLELCRRSNLRRVLVACPLPDDAGPGDRGRGGASGAAPVNSARALFEKLGFTARGALPGYAKGEAGESDACLMEWVNADHVAVANLDAVRVALVQYEMRTVENFEVFAERIEYFVRAAHGYGADFVLFPEFTSLQLLSTAALRGRTAPDAIAQLARLTHEVFEMFATLARRYGVHIIGGSHPVPFTNDGRSGVHNVCPVALPDGRVLMQPKLHITPSETGTWGFEGGAQLAVIPTPKARVGVLICYDSEFPEATRYLAEQGVDILFVPYCTDDRQGHLRVLRCCQARAIENQIYVAAAGLVGNLSGVAGLDVHYGRAAAFTPSDFSFARDGIQAEADANVETLLVTDLDLAQLHRVREHGTVRPRRDRRLDLFQLKTSFDATELSEYPLGERAALQ